MSQEIYILDIAGSKTVSVIIERKKISFCRLKVFPSQKIKLSVSSDTSSKWIKRYLQSKKDWIIEKLENFAKTKGYDATGIIKHGTSIRLLGQDMVFSICKSDKKLVSTEYRSIYIHLPDPSIVKEGKRLFETWW